MVYAEFGSDEVMTQNLDGRRMQVQVPQFLGPRLNVVAWRERSQSFSSLPRKGKSVV